MIRVFLLDDHALVRAGYRMILQNELDIDVIGESASGEEGLPVIRKLLPDVVLCDLHLPGISGLEITERLVKGQVGPKVVIVSVQEDGPMPKRLLDAGASAYVGKACDAKELLKAIREAARGKRYVGGELAQRAYQQAWLLGAKYVLARGAIGLRSDSGRRVITLDDLAKEAGLSRSMIAVFRPSWLARIAAT